MLRCTMHAIGAQARCVCKLDRIASIGSNLSHTALKGTNMSSPKFKTIDEYLASLDPVKARTIRSIIDFILAGFPGLEARISWNVPTIHRDGKYVAGVCAYKRHLTFSPWSLFVMEDFKARLREYVVLKNCFHLPVDWELDRQLVADLVRARLAELD